VLVLRRKAGEAIVLNQVITMTPLPMSSSCVKSCSISQGGTHCRRNARAAVSALAAYACLSVPRNATDHAVS